MRSIRHKTLYAAAFVFAAGFAATAATAATAAGKCDPCRQIYDACMAASGGYEVCARQYNDCVPAGCPLMPLPLEP